MTDPCNKAEGVNRQMRDIERLARSQDGSTARRSKGGRNRHDSPERRQSCSSSGEIGSYICRHGHKYGDITCSRRLRLDIRIEVTTFAIPIYIPKFRRLAEAMLVLDPTRAHARD
jgi:hypothetical protein